MRCGCALILSWAPVPGYNNIVPARSTEIARLVQRSCASPTYHRRIFNPGDGLWGRTNLKYLAPIVSSGLFEVNKSRMMECNQKYTGALTLVTISITASRLVPSLSKCNLNSFPNSHRGSAVWVTALYEKPHLVQLTQCFLLILITNRFA